MIIYQFSSSLINKRSIKILNTGSVFFQQRVKSIESDHIRNMNFNKYKYKYECICIYKNKWYLKIVNRNLNLYDEHDHPCCVWMYFDI